MSNEKSDRAVIAEWARGEGKRETFGLPKLRVTHTYGCMVVDMGVHGPRAIAWGKNWADTRLALRVKGYSV